MFTTTRRRDPLFPNTFDIEEPETKRKIWYHWLNIRLRQYMILEILFFISLIMIFYKLQTLSNQNDRVLEMISSIERKVEALAARKPKEDMEKSDGAQKMKLPTEDSTHKIESTDSKTKQLKLEIENSTTLVPISKERFRLNAADFLLGASVDKYLSSRSSLNPSFGHDQTNLVLLDRPQPPADKAWCTNDKNPVLTISLAKYIKPISVSYQHSAWNVFIPSGAPKTYDVVGCFDDDCKSWEPLVLNCQYSEDESNEAEQFCNISPDLDVPLIGKVQFRFRENYGHTRKTCVNLVRVYGETRKPLKMKKHLNSEKTCADLKWYYHNSYIKYAWTDKNCSILYENECCSECPECCQECLIHDYNGATFIFYCFWVLLASLLLLHIYLFIRYPAYRRWCRE
ncbi:hypothetical protein B9Z55_015317 [Caenorhabditis nigoni]|uniref:SUN domain-containing protein n=1 Tax=Caenorhabditis nigoni TaxID=1611254 RepID=A0A2G5UA73_9PELO|nr:hypothetical protein B9Z55_015317 [Caenorhabditis nigoni]